MNDEVSAFHRSFYEARDFEECDIDDLINRIPPLSSEASKSFEGKITLEEAALALKNMKNASAQARMDLKQAYFLKCFLKQLRPLVVRALNDAFKDGELSTTKGVIICIPKGEKLKEYLRIGNPFRF